MVMTVGDGNGWRPGGDRSPVERFARDVGINVLANLVAAAMVYLIGVWVGLWDSAVELTVGSIAAITAVALWVVLILLIRAEGARRRQLNAVWRSLVVVSMAVGAADSLIEALRDGFDSTSGIFFTVFAVLFVLNMLLLGRVLHRSRTAKAAEARNAELSRDATPVPVGRWSPDPRAYL